MSQGPQATFGVRCTKLASKHGGPQNAQMKSCPPPPPPHYLLPPFSLSLFFFFLLQAIHPKKRKKRGIRMVGWSGGGGSCSCVSSGAKQELASKRLKAVGLIWGQTECIKRWLLLSVMTTSCAPMFNYFSVMSLPTFHCSTGKTTCNSRNVERGERTQSKRNNEITSSRWSYFGA